MKKLVLIFVLVLALLCNSGFIVPEGGYSRSDLNVQYVMEPLETLDASMEFFETEEPVIVEESVEEEVSVVEVIYYWTVPYDMSTIEYNEKWADIVEAEAAKIGATAIEYVGEFGIYAPEEPSVDTTESVEATEVLY